VDNSSNKTIKAAKLQYGIDGGVVGEEDEIRGGREKATFL
jgi:hypothetical protein